MQVPLPRGGLRSVMIRDVWYFRGKNTCRPIHNVCTSGHYLTVHYYTCLCCFLSALMSSLSTPFRCFLKNKREFAAMANSLGISTNYFFLLETKPEIPEIKPTSKDAPARIRTTEAESLPSNPSVTKANRNMSVSIKQNMPKRIFVLLSMLYLPPSLNFIKNEIQTSTNDPVSFPCTPNYLRRFLSMSTQNHFL